MLRTLRSQVQGFGPRRGDSAQSGRTACCRPSLAARRAGDAAGRTGFTLVEVLVVIGIIALLVAILMPALVRARRAANSIACASNMRQVYMMLVMYSDLYRGTLPLVTRPSGAPATWPNHWMEYLEESRVIPSQGNVSITPEHNNASLGANARLYCPEFRSRISFTGVVSDNYSYAIIQGQGNLTGGIPFVTFGGRSGGNISTVIFNKFPIANAVRKLALIENASYRSGTDNSWYDSWNQYIHGGRANYCWADGHVTSENSRMLSIPYGPSSSWKPVPAVEGKGVFLRPSNWTDPGDGSPEIRDLAAMQ